MEKLWNSDHHLGKLFVGGCGTQLGLLATCGTLSVLVLFLAVCGATNAVSVAVSQEVALIPAETATATPEPTIAPTSAVLDSLLGEVQLLHGEVEYLRSNLSSAPVEAAAVTLPTATPTPPPVLVANQNDVNLRSGPGTTFENLGMLPYGSSAEIVGRDESSTWWLVATGDGLFAWVSDNLVVTQYTSDDIPVVSIPSLLEYGASAPVPSDADAAAAFGGAPVATGGPPTIGDDAVTPRELVPAGTPTAIPNAQRTFVEEMPAYKRLRGHLLIPPVSESVSPHGDQIALTERIKLYTVTTDGALTTIWIEDNADFGPLGNVVWSPDGDYLALEVGYKQKYCKPCSGVIVLRLADGKITQLEHPGELDLGAPRWTQDGRLLVNAFPIEPADGIAYEYSLSGKGVPAQGAYVLSANHEGQRWFPWRPGKTWLVGSYERADSYNAE